MKYLAIVKVDTNDADYVEKTTKINEDMLINLRSAAKKYQNLNHIQ